MGITISTSTSNYLTMLLDDKFPAIMGGEDEAEIIVETPIFVVIQK